jgi:hypothetical protein
MFAKATNQASWITSSLPVIRQESAQTAVVGAVACERLSVGLASIHAN